MIPLACGGVGGGCVGSFFASDPQHNFGPRCNISMTSLRNYNNNNETEGTFATGGIPFGKNIQDMIFSVRFGKENVKQVKTEKRT